MSMSARQYVYNRNVGVLMLACLQTLPDLHKAVYLRLLGIFPNKHL